MALTHDVCGRVIERRVERKGFRPKTWRYGWDALDRLVSCLTPEGERWFYRYDPFGRRLTKVRQLADTERAWVAKKHPALVSAGDRERTVLWTWPQAPKGHAAHDPRPPIVGTHFLWDGDVVAEEAPLRLDGSIDWDDATRWHFEPESFVPIAKQMPDGRLAWIVTDHLGTPREMFDEAGQLRWAASLTTWGVVRRTIVPPEPANDDGQQAIFPRGPTRGNLALKPEPDPNSAAYECPIRFQGQWDDEETNLFYNRHRYYDSLSCQYTNSDPIRFSGGSRPYGYVIRLNVFVDPLGLSSKFETFFRGDEPGLSEFKSYAHREGGLDSSEFIIDKGDLYKLMKDHAIESSNPPSPFISVTSDRNVAKFFAGPKGEGTSYNYLLEPP